MFYFCSKISIRSIATLLGFALLLGALAPAPALTGEAPIANRHARARIAAMNEQNAAIHALIGMSGGSVAFDARRARDLRRSLIDSAAEIPKQFRKERHDRDSHARPDIWSQWDAFEAQAAEAEGAAKALKTRSLEVLRVTLPPLIQACQSCHDRYRAPVNEFITH